MRTDSQEEKRERREREGSDRRRLNAGVRHRGADWNEDEQCTGQTKVSKGVHIINKTSEAEANKKKYGCGFRASRGVHGLGSRA